MAITKVGDWWGDRILVERSERAVGPYSTVSVIPVVPKCVVDCNTYFASWIPSSQPGQLIYGLSHNRWDGIASEVYRPTFGAIAAPAVHDVDRTTLFAGPLRLSDLRCSGALRRLPPSASEVQPVDRGDGSSCRRSGRSGRGTVSERGRSERLRRTTRSVTCVRATSAQVASAIPPTRRPSCSRTTSRRCCRMPRHHRRRRR